jgi:hypothetical protein
MQLLIYSSLNKLRFNLLHNSRLSVIEGLSHKVNKIWIISHKGILSARIFTPSVTYRSPRNYLLGK